MSDMSRDLVQQGLTAARVGDVDDARRLLTQATDDMPHNVDIFPCKSRPREIIPIIIELQLKEVKMKTVVL